MSTKAPSAGQKKSAHGKAGKPSGRTNGHKKRLRPGELDGHVLTYMCENEKDLPMTPTAIATGIGRSAGAVGNCLERLAKAKKARLAKKAPREYDLKGVKAR